MRVNRLSLFFGTLLLVSAGTFFAWGWGAILPGTAMLFVLATLFGLFMAFNIGGNDVANSFGTSVGSGTLTLRQALIVAAIFEVSGALIAGGSVTKTIRNGIVNLDTLAAFPGCDSMSLVYLMMAALLASGMWILIATKFGLPVSTTHSIVGGIVGSAIALATVTVGRESAFALIQWRKVGTIAVTWVVSPVMGGVVAYGLFWVVRRIVLRYNDGAEQQLLHLHSRLQMRRQFRAHERLAELQQIAYAHGVPNEPVRQKPGKDAQRGAPRLEKRLRVGRTSRHALEVYVPAIAGIGAMVMTSMVLFKGLKNLELPLTALHKGLIVAAVSLAAWRIIAVLAKSLRKKTLSRSTLLLFNWMQVFTASGFAFSHGSNDIANAVGPFIVVWDVLTKGEVQNTPIPTVAMIAFGIAMCAGLWFIGKEVVQTIGMNLTEIHPASGFSAELSAATVVMFATVFGIPVSSTHILVGAVLGIGLVNRATNWRLMRPIALAWVVTLPASAFLGALVFLALRAVF
ncbi:MAG: inorganic phosphate transporter [Kiritimatiellaeota bacterium]|nr:inorganic phosphate transporter [Kiritimatiellota bacterium]